MLGSLKSVALGAVEERLDGRQASFGKAVLTAGAAGIVVAGVVYKLLRSGDEPAEEGSEKE